MSRHHPYGGYDDYGPPPRGRGGPRGGGRGRGGPGPDRDYGVGRGGFPPEREWGMRGPGGPYRGGPGPYDDPYFDPGAARGRELDQGPPRGRGGPGPGRGGGGGGRGRGRVADSEFEGGVYNQRERPCRTLFIRNIKYGTPPPEIREKFERIGEVKTFFDLIANRGLVFITYYDLRAATLARDRLNATDVSGRPIDVHFSLPKDKELEQRCDRDKNQGTLFLSVSGANRPLNDDELRSRFGIFGDIKTVKPFRDSPYQRFIEFFDSRACERAHDELVNTELNGGRIDLKFSWDTGMVPSARLPRDMRGGMADEPWRRGPPPDDPPYRDSYYDDGYGYGGPPPRDDFGPPPRDPYGPPPPHDPYGEPPRGPGYGGPQGYNQPPPAAPAPPAGPPSMGDRLDQAQKVQELLASLTRAGGVPPPNNPPPANVPPPMPSQLPAQPYMPPPPQQAPAPQPPYSAPYSNGPGPSYYNGGYSAPTPVPPPPAPTGPYTPPPPHQQPPHQQPPHQQPPHQPPYQLQSPPHQPGVPQSQPPQQASASTSSGSSLPPAILALLSSAGAGSKPPNQGGPPAASSPMPPAGATPQFGAPPPSGPRAMQRPNDPQGSRPPGGPGGTAPGGGGQDNATIQQLLSLIQQNTRPR